MMDIRVVSATRKTREEFLRDCALGRSLQLYKGMPGWTLRLFPQNADPLPALYNRAIEECADDPALLLFIHDDVWLNDFYWHARIAQGLQAFDVLGVAGNRRRLPRQPGWAFVDDSFTWDERSNLSGCVGHGKGFPAPLSLFGPSGQSCKLLDGLLLAADSRVLHEKGLRFDPAFAFHFYDMDFCRQAELRGLRMGTWPLSVVHESGGAFGTPAWRSAYRGYLEKYGD
jgi:hypothetical protein